MKGLWEIFATLIGGLLLIEAQYWMPKAARRILKLAVRILIPALRARCDEEWSAHLEEIKGQISQIVFATGLIFAARGINHAAQFPTTTRTTLTAIRFFEVCYAAIRAITNLPAFLVCFFIIVKRSRFGRHHKVFKTIYALGRMFRPIRIYHLNTTLLNPKEGTVQNWFTDTAHNYPVLLSILKGDAGFIGSPYTGIEESALLLPELTPEEAQTFANQLDRDMGIVAGQKLSDLMRARPGVFDLSFKLRQKNLQQSYLDGLTLREYFGIWKSILGSRIKSFCSILKKHLREQIKAFNKKCQ